MNQRLPARRPKNRLRGRCFGNVLSPGIRLSLVPETLSTGCRDRGCPDGASTCVFLEASMELLLTINHFESLRAGISSMHQARSGVEEKSRSLYGFRARSTRTAQNSTFALASGELPAFGKSRPGHRSARVKSLALRSEPGRKLATSRRA